MTIAVLITASPFLVAAICGIFDDSASAIADTNVRAGLFGDNSDGFDPTYDDFEAADLAVAAGIVVLRRRREGE